MGKGSLKGCIVYKLKKQGKAKITYSGEYYPYDEEEENKEGTSGDLGEINGRIKKVKNGDDISLSDGKALEVVLYNKKKEIYLSTILINNCEYFNVVAG